MSLKRDDPFGRESQNRDGAIIRSISQDGMSHLSDIRLPSLDLKKQYPDGKL